MDAQQQNSSINGASRGSGAVSDIVGVSREWASKLLKPETWYSMSVGLKRLQELIQGTSSLTDDPVWLLGLWYGLQDGDSNKSSMTPELHQLLLEDLHSRFWFTYRRDFPALGPHGLTSDVGWGCTLRSGQMLLAEAISRCWWGRCARFAAAGSVTQANSAGASCAPAQQQPSQHHTDLQWQGQQQQQHGGAATQNQQPAQCAQGSSSSSQPGLDQLSLLRLFVEDQGTQAPFSVHNLCAAGAPHGVVAGQWLGPWVLCKALAAAAAAAASQQGLQQHHQQQCGLGLHVHVACDPGGGAPELNPVQLRQLLAPSSSSSCGGVGTGQEQLEQPLQQPQKPQQEQHAQQQVQRPGLLLLVPLTLGVGKVNERYLPQLTSVLTFPQSVGIVGGRPGASLFFVGVQAGAVLYLDPHEVQEVPVLPGDAGSFHCSLPRLMPLTAIDPSLAIGFFCANMSELDDLLSRLQGLAASAGGAPLMTVEQPGRVSSASDAAAAAGAGGGGSGAAAAADGEEAEGGKADDWELV